MDPIGPLVLFALGAVVGTALDHLHVLGGVLAYPRPAFWGEAAFVPHLFGGATVSLVLLWRLAFRGQAPRWPHAGRFGLYLLDFAFAYLLTVLLRDLPWISLAALTVTWLTLAAPHGPRLVAYGVVVAIAGTLTEAALCRLGLFGYLSPGLLPGLAVPLWLPGLYLHASLATRALDLAFFPRRGPALAAKAAP